MRTLHAFIAVLATASAANAAWAADRRVPQDYPSIQAAADAAKPGDRIVVSRGRYLESVRIEKSDLTFVGRKAVWDTWDPGVGFRPSLVVVGDRTSVSGFTFTSGTVQIDLQGSGARVTRCTSRTSLDAFVRVTGDGASVTKCRVSAAHERGLWMYGSGHVVSGNVLDHCRGGAIDVEWLGTTDDPILVSRNTIRNANGAAIRVVAPRARVERNRVESSAGTAMDLYGAGIGVDRNVVRDCAGAAISVVGTGFRITRNTVWGARSIEGAIIADVLPGGGSGGPAVVEGNRVFDGEATGLLVRSSGAEGPTLRGNLVERSGGNGPAVLIFGDYVLVEDLRVVEPAYAGLFLQGDGNTIRGSTFEATAHDGIIVSGTGNRIEDCEIRDATYCGLDNRGVGTTFVGCRISGSRWDVTCDELNGATFANAATLERDNDYDTGGPTTQPGCD